MISQAPFIFITGLSIAVFLTWKLSQAFYKRHVSVLEAQRDHFQALAGASAKDSNETPGAFTPDQRNRLVDTLNSLPTPANWVERSVSVFSLMSNPRTSETAEVISAAFIQAGWYVSTGKAESQWFFQERRNRYASGVWVVGPERETVASALLSVGVKNVRIDRDETIGTTCILIVSTD